jgi:D-lactate dehydrogenase (cytochrome)
MGVRATKSPDERSEDRAEVNDRMSDDEQPPAADFLEDAAHYPGGHAAGVVFPRSIDDIVRAIESADSVLPIGAQSSLTGGATPMGELILATSRMTKVLRTTGTSITVQAGLTVAAMQERLAEADAWFPPAPTFTGACAGGIVATNAAGAATFKYGSTRDWVEALTIVLADGTVLDVARGQVRANQGRFEVQSRQGLRSVLVPTYRLPDVPKCSAGYHATPDMDLIDLFIGSEGTLGVIAEVTFKVLARPPQVAFALVPCTSEHEGFAVAAELRAAAMNTWRTRDPAGIDIAAIEHMDRRSIDVVREDGADRRHDVSFPPSTELALLVQIELSRSLSREAAFDQIADSASETAADSALGRFCRILDRAGLLGATEIALPGDRRRAEDLIAVREAVPAGVNQRVGAAKRDVDPRIEKTAADMIVPFERMAGMMEIYRRGFQSRNLAYAVWGHLSDGNVHPNVIPRSFDDVRRGKEAILEFGREVARLGGCPLAEHGVGRNPVKQSLLRQLYGDEGIDQMRAVKHALDPQWKLAPGVIFSRLAD